MHLIQIKLKSAAGTLLPPPVLPPNDSTGGCCAAGFQSRLCRLGVKTGSALVEHITGLVLRFQYSHSWAAGHIGRGPHGQSAESSPACCQTNARAAESVLAESAVS